MVNFLVRNTSIVLQNVEIYSTDSFSNLLRDRLGTQLALLAKSGIRDLVDKGRAGEEQIKVDRGSTSIFSSRACLNLHLIPSTYQDLDQVLVRNVGQFRTVELGYDKLGFWSIWFFSRFSRSNFPALLPDSNSDLFGVASVHTKRLSRARVGGQG